MQDAMLTVMQNACNTLAAANKTACDESMQALQSVFAVHSYFDLMGADTAAERAFVASTMGHNLINNAMQQYNKHKYASAAQALTQAIALRNETFSAVCN